MISPISLHAIAHGLVLSGVSSPCRRACSANAFAWHFALHLGLHSVRSSGAPITGWLAADLLRIAVQPAVFSGGSPRLHGPCRRAWRACAFARHTAQHAALHSMQPPHVQASSPGRDCRERMREANAEGKTKGCGTYRPAKPVCTWGWRGTQRLRRRAAWGARPAPMQGCPRASHDRTRHSFQGAQP